MKEARSLPLRRSGLEWIAWGWSGMWRAVAPRLMRRWPLLLTRCIVNGDNNAIQIGSGAQLWHCRICVRGSNNTIEIGPGATLRRVLFKLEGSGHRVVIGRDVRVNREAQIWIEDHGCRVSIGDRTSIEQVHLAATEPEMTIDLGTDCMLAYGIEIRTGDSHPIVDANSGERLNPARAVRLGNRVWLGAQVAILKGVTLGDDCVVGTGSVLTRSPGRDGVVLAGNPAKVVRDGVRWRAQRDD